MRSETNYKSGSATRTLIHIALVLFVIFCTVSIIRTQNAIVEQRQALAELEEQVDVLAAENEELAALIASDDIGSYMEKLALESAGYAYPDERRYYDTSRK
ncbi:MAG: septum formation initiator family protein [Oscillospiraceae bacterium]|nr:septum formation initiator family protein [Oscillospiraceae bacterium]